MSKDAGFDCDDADETIHPDAVEVCDTLDNDCDGDVDDDDEDRVSGTVFFIDLIATGTAAPTTSHRLQVPDGYTTSSDDCDDLSADVYPGADERCDSVDNNCDGDIDGSDAVDMPTWYLDADGDGYGVSEVSTASCMPVGSCSPPAETAMMTRAISRRARQRSAAGSTTTATTSSTMGTLEHVDLVHGCGW